MNVKTLQFAFFVQRQPLTVEYLQTLLHRVWQHGLHFHNVPPQAPTWEAQWEAQGRCYIDDAFHMVPLHEACRMLATSGQGALTLHDHALALELRIGDTIPTHLTSSMDVAQYERMVLRIDPTFMISGEMQTRNALILQPYPQIGNAYAHWCRVFAEVSQASVAIGYDTNVLETQGNTLDTEFIWATTLLQTHQFQAPLWSLMWYLDASFAHIALSPSLFARPGMNVQSARNGGLWGLTPQWIQFSQEVAAMYEEISDAAPFEQGILANLSDQAQRERYLELAAQHFERALELAQAVDFVEGERLCAVHITRMIELAANLKLPPIDFLADQERLHAELARRQQNKEQEA
jgi:hypothetical protein